MRVRALAGLALTAVWASAPAAHDFPHAEGVDLTRLPLGDAHVSSEPRIGWIWSCPMPPGGGADVIGPWFNGDGTFDFTKKPQVSGEVMWPHKFEMSIVSEKRVFTSNDLPDHPTGIFPIQRSDEARKYDRNPNAIAAQDIKITLPMDPVVAARPTCAPAAVGILLTGAVLFNALDAMGRDAVAHETQDSCQGHPQRLGTYHYHSLTTCFDDKQLADGHSALAGYAIDGFGIYGRHGEGGKILTSADLDACHGHTHPIEWNGRIVDLYHYHSTWDFPYTIGCMRGTYRMRDVMILAGQFTAESGQSQRAPGPGPGRIIPDFEGAAAKLGVSRQQLLQALGPPPPDLAAAADRLGTTESALREALGLR